jgi:PAS domain S-box-containing protein
MPPSPATPAQPRAAARIRRRFERFVDDRMSPAAGPSLARWRERLFFGIYGCAALVSLPAFAVNTWIAAQAGKWGWVAGYAAACAATVAVVWARGIPYRLRAGVGLFVFYFLGALSFATIGPAGSGRMWLLAFSMLASLLLGPRAGVAALALNLATFLVLSFLIASGRLAVAVPVAHALRHWLAAGLTFLFLNTVVTVALGLFVERLRRSIAAQLEVNRELDEAARRLAAENRERRLAEARRDATESELRRLAAELEARVARRTGELEAANRGLAAEIEERRRVEAALRDSEIRYRQLVECAPAGIYEADLEAMKLISVNDIMCAILGYSREELLAMDPLDLFTAESREAVRRRVLEILAGAPGGGSFEHTVRAKDGRTLWVLLNSTILAEPGRPTRAVTVVHDITRLKSLELQLQQAQKMEAIGTLAGGIAHDFNNLLMAIQGTTSLMLHGMAGGNPHAAMLQRIEAAVASGKRLTQQILGYARLGTYDVRPLDLNRLAAQTLETFGRTRKEVTIETDLAAGLPPVEADEGQLTQVILNLCVNAAEAMPDGGRMTVATAAATHGQIRGAIYTPRPGRYVRLSVADSGCGMDAQTRQRVFEPFFTTKAMGRGTGLGLASVFGIVKAHRGYIEVESEPGRGSTFHVFLPAAENRPAAVAAAPPAPRARRPAGVLVVDDEEPVRVATAGLLAALGHTAVAAASGREALRLFGERRTPIDLVILDMVMPDMAGGEVFDRLKAMDPGVKVLLSSGYSLNSRIADILRRGCDGFIQKPFTLESLAEALKGFLPAEGAAERPQEAPPAAGQTEGTYAG